MDPDDSWDPSALPRARIVAGIDGSLEGQDALRFGFELAEATSAELVGVHAVAPHESYPDPSAWTSPARPPWLDAADTLLTETLVGSTAKYTGVSTVRFSIADHPVCALARESTDADLVVLGGPGHTAFSELRLGSVARGLRHHSACPVAVIHHI